MKTDGKKRIAIFTARFAEVFNDPSRGYQLIGKRYRVGDVVRGDDAIAALQKNNAPIEIYVAEKKASKKPDSQEQKSNNQDESNNSEGLDGSDGSDDSEIKLEETDANRTTEGEHT